MLFQDPFILFVGYIGFGSRQLFRIYQLKLLTLVFVQDCLYSIKKLNILIDENQMPVGGKWSFGEENRKKMPKNIQLPEKFKKSNSKYIKEISTFIINNFS